jgi:hypothetical protein
MGHKQTSRDVRVMSVIPLKADIRSLRGPFINGGVCSNPMTGDSCPVAATAGFDHFYGNLVGEVDYFTKERGGIIDWQRPGD